MSKNKSSGTKSGTSAKTLVVLALKGGKRTEKPKAEKSSAPKAKAPRTPSLLAPPRRSR